MSARQHRYSSPRERYNAESKSNTYASTELVNKDQFNEALDVKEPPYARHVAADHRSRHANVSCEESLMISRSRYFESRWSEGSPALRASPVSTVVDQVKATPRARRVPSKETAKHHPGSLAWRRGHGGNVQDSEPGSGSKPESGDDDDMGDGAGRECRREQRPHSPCQETSSQQSEKDQRMWSALKTSLLSGNDIRTDPYVGIGTGRAEYREIADGRDYIGIGTDAETRSYAFLRGTRDMEQLDLERSAMDRTMRPHRVASARLLETNQESPSPNKVGTTTQRWLAW